MLKYIGYQTVLQEVPDEISLAINISGCPHRCEGCHSKYLWEDTGEPLLEDLPELLQRYDPFISCVCFMGGDQDENELIKAIEYIRKNCHAMAICLYTGSYNVSERLLNNLDYIKVGPYIEKYGGLNSKETNQKMYKIHHNPLRFDDITYRFHLTPPYKHDNIKSEDEI